MLIKNATIINEGQSFKGSVLVKGDTIQSIFHEGDALPADDDTLDAEGLILVPGVIDDHVHMRDPGLTHKADMHTETMSALAGGVTSVMDMPNVVPQTTTMELWQQRMDYASQHCHANYAFYLGATNDNLQEIRQIDTHRIPALKLFMGSSTGGMLVDREEQLRQIFTLCPTIIMTHCEDTTRINQRMAEAKAQQGDDPDVSLHPWIRDDEACFLSSALAVKLAKETGARLHIAHITTQKELALIPTSSDLSHAQITAEACPQHLLFTDADYATLGTLIKCNPAIKSSADREALRQAVSDGRIQVVGTDHAPHLLSEKEGGAGKAVSGMPLVQFSLPLMLTLASQGVFSREHVVELMCHNPSILFGIEGRGFIREGYKADLVLLSPTATTVTHADVISKCGWTPLVGQQLSWKVEHTFVNGLHAYSPAQGVDTSVMGEPLTFSR